VRSRVLRWFARAGHLDPAGAPDMPNWDYGGGSFDPVGSRLLRIVYGYATAVGEISEIRLCTVG
jgi:hypothetical protein